MLTPYDIAEKLKVSYDTALAFIKYSGIPYLKIGRQYRVTEEDFDAFVNKKGRKEIDISGTSDIYY